jgi:DNA ligase-1
MSLNYWVYDVPRKNSSFISRWDELASKIQKVVPIRFTVCPTYYVASYNEVLIYFNRFIKEGFEGLIFRDATSFYEFDKRSYGLLKLKPWHTTEARILRFDEGKGRLKGSLGALVCITAVPGKVGKVVKVGSGLDDNLRRKIWSNPHLYINNIVTIKYQELTKAGVPRFPIFLRFRDE